MRRVWYYAGIFLLTLLVALTHPGEFPRFLLGFELLLFFCLWLQVRLLCRRISLRWKGSGDYGQKGAPIRVELELTNRGRLPVPEVTVCLGCRDLLTGAVRYYTGTAMLDGGGDTLLIFCLESDYCGAVSLWIEEVRVWDYFGGFSGTCVTDLVMREISILPDGTAVLPEWDQGQAFRQKPAGGTGADVSYSAGGGADPSDTFDIRFFRQGDTLRRVHWKLFAKTGELLVRDMAVEEDNRMLVCLDLHSGVTIEVWDHFLETVAALSAALLRQDCAHDVMWRETGAADTEDAVVCLSVQDEEESKTMLARLLRAGSAEPETAGDTQEAGNAVDAVRLSDREADGRRATDMEERRWNEAYWQVLQVDLEGNICRMQEKYW